MFNKKKEPVGYVKHEPHSNTITYETIHKEFTAPKHSLEIPAFMDDTIYDFKFINDNQDIYSITKEILEGDYTSVNDLHIKLTQDLIANSPAYRDIFIKAFLTEDYTTKEDTYLCAMVKGGAKLEEPYYWTHNNKSLGLEKMSADNLSAMPLEEWSKLGINETIVDFVPKELFEDKILIKVQ